MIVINPGTDGFILNCFNVAHSERMTYGTAEQNSETGICIHIMNSILCRQQHLHCFQ